MSKVSAILFALMLSSAGGSVVASDNVESPVETCKHIVRVAENARETYKMGVEPLLIMNALKSENELVDTLFRHTAPTHILGAEDMTTRFKDSMWRCIGAYIEFNQKGK